MPVRVRALVCAVVTTCLWMAEGHAESRDPGQFPGLTTPAAGVTGAAAVAALGENLPAVAARHGKSAAALRNMLLTDSTLHLDKQGRIYVVDPAPKPQAEAAPAAATVPWVGGTIAPFSKTFKLHSNPTASKTIQLKFDGMDLDGTPWSPNGRVVAPPFDLDGKPHSFSEEEMTLIQRIWQRVAEDFAPFDVNVTTATVPRDSISRSRADDVNYGTVVLFAPYISELDCKCTSIAIMNSFNGPDSQKPVLVQYSVARGDNIGDMLLGDAASHGLGHTLGLTHDGTSLIPMYPGHGIHPVTAWEPIMGLQSGRPVSQFSRGEYLGANNYEDDFAVMVQNGLPFRLDDVTNLRKDAPRLKQKQNGVRSTAEAEGIIGTASDRDVFSLLAGPGTLTARVDPAGSAPNADLMLTLFDRKGNVLSYGNPQGQLSASLTQPISTLTRYYLEVRADGEGDVSGNGYSSYGSVGAYRLSVSFATPGVKSTDGPFYAFPPDGVAPLAVNFNGKGASSTLAVTSYRWDFGDGSEAVMSSQSTVSKTFVTPGIYTVTLTVSDEQGRSETFTRLIRASGDPTIVSPKVSRIDASLMSAGRKGVRGKAVVTVVDSIGRPVPSAVVLANWSGVTTANVSGKARKTGSVILNSPLTQSTGCMRLTVTAILVKSTTHTLSDPPYREVCN